MKSKLSPKIAKMVMLASAPALLSGAYASANTLTGLIPDLYAAMDVVSRELVGFVPSVFRNVSAERAAVGENVTYHVAPAMAASDITPAMTPPTPTDRTLGTGSLQITKARRVEFGWVGEEQKGLNNGPGFLTVQGDMFAQALRTLTNEIEIDLATEAYQNASRAYGTAGATAFGTNTGETAQVRKMLDDNGAPASGRSLVINTSAGANLRTLSNLTRVNESGTSMTLRDGQLLDLNGLSIKESNGIQTVTAGTAAATGTTDSTGYAVGVTSIGTAATGSGTLLAGDYITFAGDTNKYLVVTGKAAMGTGTTAIVIAAPGLRQAVAASAVAITVVGTSARNIGLVSNALHFVARAPALPAEGDLAIDRMMMIDPRSGIAFEVSIYPGYRKIYAEVALAWGKKAVKREHIVCLLG